MFTQVALGFGVLSWSAGLRTSSRIRRISSLFALLAGLVVYGHAGYVLGSTGLPPEPHDWILHIGWTLLGAWMIELGPKQTFSVRSTAIAIPCILLGAWLPALVALGRGAGEPMDNRVLGLLFAHLGASWGLRDAVLWTANHLGFLHLSIDGTTLASHLLLGSTWWLTGVGLAIAMVHQHRLDSSETPAVDSNGLATDVTSSR